MVLIKKEKRWKCFSIQARCKSIKKSYKTKINWLCSFLGNN